MPAGIQVIRNGLVSTFAACGPYAASEISSCDFGTLETVSGCAIMVHLMGESPASPLTFGQPANLWIAWQLGVDVYIRYTGDSPTFLSKVYQAADDMVTTLSKDTTLQSSACYAFLKSIAYDINEGYNMGGVEMGVVHFAVEAHDF